MKKSYIITFIVGALSGAVSWLIGYHFPEWQYWLIIILGIVSYLLGRSAESKS